MKRVPYVSIILENADGEVLLLLRDNRSAITCPKHWTLIGGKVENDETPEVAAQRALKEETGLRTNLSFWTRYDREHPLFVIDQYIFTGTIGNAHNLPVVGRDMQFFRPAEVGYLDIGYGFDSILKEYFLIHER